MATNPDAPEQQPSTLEEKVPPTEIKQTESSISPLDLPDALLSSNNGGNLIDVASAAVSALANLNTDIPKRKAEVYANTIAAIYPLMVEFSRDQQVRAALMERYKVKQRKNTPDAVYVTQAIIRSNKSVLPKTTENDIAKVLRALAIEEVPTNADAVRDWFSTPEDVLGDGNLLTGQRKAFAILKKHSAGTIDNAAEMRIKNRKKREQEHWDRFVAKHFDEAPLDHDENGLAPPAEDSSCITISIVEGNRQKSITVAGERAQKVRKFLLSSSDKPDTQNGAATVLSNGMLAQTGGSEDE